MKNIEWKEPWGQRKHLRGYYHSIVRSAAISGLCLSLIWLAWGVLRLLAEPPVITMSTVITQAPVFFLFGVLLRLIAESAAREVSLFQSGIQVRWAYHRHGYYNFSRFSKIILDSVRTHDTCLYTFNLIGEKPKMTISIVLPSCEMALEVFHFLKHNTEIALEEKISKDGKETEEETGSGVDLTGTRDGTHEDKR